MILFPHAKINIGLNILKIREDGYHEISSVFYPVKQCYDVLEITEQQHFSFVKSGIKIPDGENLCEKAFHLLKKDFSFANVEIHLYKHIPIGAGLGGGSADAALTLMGLNQLFELELNKTQLKKYALSLGADCPFFIDDRPTLVEGIGEKLSPIDLDLNGFEIWSSAPELSNKFLLKSSKSLAKRSIFVALNFGLLLIFLDKSNFLNALIHLALNYMLY